LLYRVSFSNYCANIANQKQKNIYKYTRKRQLFSLVRRNIIRLGTIFSIIANRTVAGSITQTIIQFNGVWTVLITIFIFKELDFKKHWLRISAGIILAILGILLLTFA
jgi:glucose uptake protein GlcU